MTNQLRLPNGKLVSMNKNKQKASMMNIKGASSILAKVTDNWGTSLIFLAIFVFVIFMTRKAIQGLFFKVTGNSRKQNDNASDRILDKAGARNQRKLARKLTKAQKKFISDPIKYNYLGIKRERADKKRVKDYYKVNGVLPDDVLNHLNELTGKDS